MAKISDLSGDERAQRIAELKRKMQESASRNKAESAAEPEEAAGEAPATDVAPEAATQEAEAQADSAPAQAGEATVEAAAEAEEVQSQVVDTVAETATPEEVGTTEDAAEDTEPAPAGNGAVAPADLAAATAVTLPEQEVDPELALRKEMNRREFLTYTWGAALGLLLLQGGVASFLFMYPRFKEGEFGGKFRVGDAASVPSPTDVPQAWTDGKFWLISTEENEPRALYMVCTHLGCLYKWVNENFRFECPCHGSKFSHDGYYIEGPASRSLDYFATEIAEDGQVVVDTGKKTQGGPAIESPERLV